MMSLRNRKQNFNEKQKNKINEIREALNNNDIYTLRKLSRTEGGFVTSELRKLCWPFLLHVDVSKIRISENNESDSKINNENENSNIDDENIERENNTQNEVEENLKTEYNDCHSDIDQENELDELIEKLNEEIDNKIEDVENNVTDDSSSNNKDNDVNDAINSNTDDNVEEAEQLETKSNEVLELNEASDEKENIKDNDSSEQVEVNDVVEKFEKIKIDKEEEEEEEENVEENEKNSIEKVNNNEQEDQNCPREINEQDKTVLNETFNSNNENNDIEKKDIKQEFINNDVELIKDNMSKDETPEFQENYEIKDDLNSETLKDENNEIIENITQENMVIASQSSNDDTYLEKEPIDKKENLLENSDNEDYTKNNHSDDDGDDVLFEGDLNINAGDIHESHFKDNGENEGIFDGENANSKEQTSDNTTEPTKVVAKDLVLDPDDDPERMDKLKEIENDSKYRDKRQIMLDVNRAFVHFPKGLKAREKTVKQIELSKVILYSLNDHSYLHYYQGYHDICSLLLLVLGENIAKPCAEILALYWLREYMKETLEPTLEVMSLLYPILKYADPKIYKLVYNNMIPPYFSISWVITWCIHDLRDTSEMERIFDFFISNNPIMPIYFAAAVILTQKEKLYKRFPQILNDNSSKNAEDDNDPETAMPNFSVVHQFLTNLLPIATQSKDVTVDSAVELAWNLYEQYPLKFLMKKESIKLNPLCCVRRYFDDCEKVLPNQPFNKEEIVRLLKEEERLNLEKTMASPNSKKDHLQKIQEKADIIGNYLSQRITLWTIATTLILVTAIILTHEFSKTYYM